MEGLSKIPPPHCQGRQYGTLQIPLSCAPLAPLIFVLPAHSERVPTASRQLNVGFTRVGSGRQEGPCSGGGGGGGGG